MGIQESWNEKENTFLRNKIILLLFFLYLQITELDKWDNDGRINMSIGIAVWEVGFSCHFDSEVDFDYILWYNWSV